MSTLYKLRSEPLTRTLKTCPKCKELKDLNNFHRNKRSKDKRSSRCKNCIGIATTSSFYTQMSNANDDTYSNDPSIYTENDLDELNFDTVNQRHSQ